MVRFRRFRNTDPPHFADIWRSQVGQPGLAQPVAIDLFEQHIFGKLYFDYEGLIFAFDESGRALGFVHAAFGPDAARRWISPETGIVAMLRLRPEACTDELAAALVEHAEGYLASRGAQVALGGGVRPYNPFYMGLYGGAELPGVLESDIPFQTGLALRGFQAEHAMAIFRCDLHDWQSPVDRRYVQFRRRLLVQVIVDPPPRDRWEAFTSAEFDLTRFELVPREGGPPLAVMTVREVALGTACPAQRTAGVVELEVAPAFRRQGLAGYLMGETLRMLAGQGFQNVEVHTQADNPAGLGLLQKFGFRQCGQGTVYRKPLCGSQ